MVDRFYEQRKAIIEYISNQRSLEVSFTGQQWDLIEKLIATLKPCEEITLQLSKSSALVSEIIPIVTQLKNLLLSRPVPGINTFRETLIQSVEERFRYIYNI
jgi:exonuclease V gamma subunit